MNEITKAMLEWHQTNARELPWRGERDPYRVYVSEMMLQQTRTQTVEAYYPRFLARFPGVESLARAEEEEVLKAWEGLGYYARARNLRAAAIIVADELGGRFPETYEGLLRLPGVGAYAAGAVSSIAFGARALALDGNGIRVLSRLTGERGRIDKPDTRARLFAFGTSLLPETGPFPYPPGEFNQALMGLGNLACVPRAPLCGACPVAAFCAARAAGATGEIPVKPPKAEKRAENRVVAVIVADGRALVRKRRARLLSGLSELPNWLEGTDGLSETLARAGARKLAVRDLPEARHVFTHIIWQMRGLYVEAAVSPGAALPEDWAWVTGAELSELAMPTAFRAYRAVAEEALTI